MKYTVLSNYTPERDRTEGHKTDQFDLIVTRDDRKSILLEYEVVSLPDFFLQRRGQAQHILLLRSSATLGGWSSRF